MEKFVLIAQARSGSTLLRQSLQAHPDIICHGEVLSRKWINGLVPLRNPGVDRSPRGVVELLMETRDNDIAGFLETNIYAFDAQAVGFKIVYEDLFMSERSDDIVSYIQSTGLRVFHLIRGNPLAGLVSRKRMALFGVSHSDAPDTQREPVKEIEIPAREINGYVRRQSGFRDKVNSLFPIAVNLRYEQIEPGFQAILDSLGVSDMPMEIKLKKMNKESLDSAVTNYDEVSEFDRELL